MNHLERIDGGRLWVDGELVGYRRAGNVLHELREREVARKREQVGMVFQHDNLFPHMTALENVMCALVKVRRQPREAVRAQARELLDRVGLADHAGHYPRQMSGGQQQRVAIARALAVQPKVMLMAVIVVTHEMGFAREVANTVVFMDEGLVVEEGSPEQVLGAPQHHRTRAFLSRVL